MLLVMSKRHHACNNCGRICDLTLMYIVNSIALTQAWLFCGTDWLERPLHPLLELQCPVCILIHDIGVTNNLCRLRCLLLPACQCLS